MTQPFTLGRYIAVIRRRKWLVLQSVFLVLGMALLLGHFSQRQYEARAEVLLNYENLAATLSGSTNGGVPQQADRIAATQARLARVPEVLERVVDASGVTNLTAAALSDSSSVVPQASTDLLVFKVRRADAQEAQVLTTEYARQFVRYRSELDTAAITRALEDVRAQMQELRRSGQTETGLYASFLEKEQQLRTLGALQSSRASLVREAAVGQQVSPPSVRALLLVGGLLGLLLGVSGAFAWHALDNRVRTVEEAAELVGLPQLALVPAPRRRERQGLVSIEEPNSPEAEAFRILRVSLDLMDVDRKARIIMVTSAGMGEGKSTTVANLAVAEARAGKKVVLVDLDVRRPGLARLFGAAPNPGVTDVALGQTSLQEALLRVDVDDAASGAAFDGDLQLLVAGTAPPDAGGFVASRAVRAILAELSEAADMVLVDAPPMMVVADPRAISSAVDGIFVVTRINQVERHQLADLRRVLDSVPVAKLGFVATGTSSRAAYRRDYVYTGAVGSRTVAKRA